MVHARSLICVVALILCSSFTALANNPSGSCSASSPCTQGCCSNTGYCGFGPTYCGQGNCTSNCNAQAQCGQYAPAGQTTCPLNVCCSQYGFCGTTSDFCGTGCQNGCAVPTAPSCASSGGSSNLRTIGYYESWSYQRSCDTWTPESIDATQWTHLNYAFALIGSDFRISQMNSFDTQLYPRFTGLKSQNPALKVFISVGGWAAGGQIFSQMTSSESNRQAFISSAIAFMNTYAFDGIDIDWEYPVAPDRQGAPADFQNYVTFLRELRAACGSQFGISITIPTSYWYMQHFDIINLEPSLDWFNLMAYDLHGTWDGTNPYTQAVVQAHTNLTEIDQAAQLLWRNNIDPNKVVLGLGFYGRSFTLKSSSCTTPGCPFSGGGNPGNCTQTSGILSDAEIQGVITQYGVTPVLDPVAAVKYLTWSGNQWVSYDDTQTFNLKRAYANSHCLSGTMVWAVDLDSDTGSGVNSLNSGNLSFANAQLKAATSSYNGATLGVFWTPCLPPGSQVCPSGYDEVALGHGKVFDADLNHVSGEGCHGGGNGFNRVLCAPRGLYLQNCAWGSHNAGLCNSMCPKGYITITKNSHKGGARIGCDVGRYTPFCCQYVTGYSGSQCYSSPLNHALAGSLAARDDPSGISQYSYSNTANYKIRRDDELAEKGNLTEGQEDEQTDKAVSKLVKRQGTGGYGCLGNGPLPIGAIPVDIPAYIFQDYNGIGFGGGYDVSLSPVATASATTSSRNRKTIYTTIPTDVTIYSTATRTCNGAKYPQACLNYRSIASAYSYVGYGTPTCAPTGVKNPARPLVDLYNAQRNTAWINTWITKTYINPNGKRAKPNCQRDEWPPAYFQQGVPQGYIRLLPGAQNGGVANDKMSGWKGFCKYPPEQRTSLEGGPVSYYYDIVYTTIYSSRITTLSVMDYEYTSMPTYAGDKDGLTTNACYPSTLIQDPGFALLNSDHYYLLSRSGNNYQTYDYKYPPGAYYTAGKTPPSKRGLSPPESPPGFEYHDEEEVITFDDGNSTRIATDEELLEHFDLARCNSPDCAEELAELEELENVLLGKPLSAPAPTDGVLAETSTLEHVAMVTAAASVRQSWQSTTAVTQTRVDVQASRSRSPVTRAPEPTAVILDLQQDADSSVVNGFPSHVENEKDDLRRRRIP